jgi:hypothetical protein
VLGLTAQNSVEIYHPVKRDSTVAPEAVTSGPCVLTGGTVTVAAAVTSAGPISCTTTVTTTYANDSGTADPYQNITAYPGDVSGSKVRWIYAAMQTLQHSLKVQSYNRADVVGRISIRGSIAQKFRGITFFTSAITSKQHGYSKDYRYDDRLKTASPPEFLRFEQSIWKIKTTGEIQTDPYLRRT